MPPFFARCSPRDPRPCRPCVILAVPTRPHAAPPVSGTHAGPLTIPIIRRPLSVLHNPPRRTTRRPGTGLWSAATGGGLARRHGGAGSAIDRRATTKARPRSAAFGQRRRSPNVPLPRRYDVARRHAALPANGLMYRSLAVLDKGPRASSRDRSGWMASLILRQPHNR